MKTIPKINEMIQKIQDNLHSIESINTLEEEIQFLEKALACYESDIHKAQDTGNEYFVKLIGDMTKSQQDLSLIKKALVKIKQYSD